MIIMVMEIPYTALFEEFQNKRNLVDGFSTYKQLISNKIIMIMSLLINIVSLSYWP